MATTEWQPDPWREWVAANGIVAPITDEHVERFAEHLVGKARDCYEPQLAELRARVAELEERVAELAERLDDVMDGDETAPNWFPELVEALGLPVDETSTIRVAIETARSSWPDEPTRSRIAELEAERERLRSGLEALGADHEAAIESAGNLTEHIAELEAENAALKAALSGPVVRIPDGADSVLQRITRGGTVGFESGDGIESLALLLPDGPGLLHVVFVPEGTRAMGDIESMQEPSWVNQQAARFAREITDEELIALMGPETNPDGDYLPWVRRCIYAAVSGDHKRTLLFIPKPEGKRDE